MSTREAANMMPMCYCCELSTGLTAINFVLVALCGLDGIIESSFRTANIFLASVLEIPRNGEIMVLWAYTAVTVLCGISSVKMAPSNKKGMFLKLWRGLIFGFMLLWLARVFMNMKTLSKWQTEALTKYQTNVHLSWFLKKLRTFIETALAWLAYEDVAFPQNWAFFMSQHKLCLIYFCIILPFWMLGLSISFINMYMQITLNGQLDLEEGLFRRRDLRKRRQQERLALLTHNASEEIT